VLDRCARACFNVPVRIETAHREELQVLVEAFGDELPLDRTMLLLAREEYPEVDVRRYLGQLDRLADRARIRATQMSDLQRAMAETLFVDEGFRGNADQYYDPKNSLLNEVIDRRLGIPITLSIVYMETARRVGTRASGIGFPGHFLVRHELADRSVLVDPFNGGSIVRRADCERLLENVTGGSAELEPWMLTPATPKNIILRVLTNLKHAYMLRKDFINAVKAIDRLLIIDPSRWSDRRDRGLLFVELECVSAAVRDLESYLEHAPEGADVEVIRRVIPSLRAQISVMN
jgi:regulator of sirC expression with transglutaminase-like and TPR domain